MLGNPLLLGDDGYNISRSVRLRSSASAYLNRTPASAGSRTTWTWSGWVKRGTLGGNQILFDANGTTNLTNYSMLWLVGDSLEYQEQTTTGMVGRAATTQVLRDPSAWYHIVCVFNSTSATSTITGSSTDRIRLYVNGVQITAFSSTTVPSQNYTSAWNNTVGHAIGNASSGTSYLFDGYLTEVNFIDGQALTPSSFGETDSITGVWKPKKYAGTYGTNGFYLNFSDQSAATAAAIGKDSSGNGNNWTPNNISVTAGVTYDSMIDVPTMYADGGNGRGNYAVLNPLQTHAYAATSQGNLRLSGASAVNSGVSVGTLQATSSKWYWEVTETTTSTNVIGVATKQVNDPAGLLNAETGFFPTYGIGIRSSGTAFGISGEVQTPSAFTYTTGDVIGVAVDGDNGAVYFSKNGTWLNSGVPTSGSSKTGAIGKWTVASDRIVQPAQGAYNTGVVDTNFGQRPFAYTPPTGFKALNTQNLPDATIKAGNKYFDATTYTGNGSSQSIVNSGAMQPDLVWTKGRSGVTNHSLVDSVRGIALQLSSNQTVAEVSDATEITALNSNGFSVGNSSGAGYSTNANGTTYVGWQWKANGTAVSNTSGTITSSVSAGATQGFSVATFTTPSSFTNATVGHGLGVAPSMIITRRRTTSDWITWHKSLGTNGYLTLNTTSAVGSNSGAFNGTSSTTWTMGSNTWWQASASDYIAYVFAEVAGYSKFGSYTGNGSADGPFVYLGFRPRFIMIKRTDTTSNWVMWDTARDTYNAGGLGLYPNLSAAEDDYRSSNPDDILSNGFKPRANYANVNASGGTYIFMAVAENPFKNSLAR